MRKKTNINRKITQSKSYYTSLNFKQKERSECSYCHVLVIYFNYILLNWKSDWFSRTFLHRTPDSK